jgi:uncharacterized membrane protein
MSDRALKIASAATILLLAGVAAVAAARLPAGTRLPIHWNAGGQADGFAGAPVALFAPVMLCAGLSGLMMVLPRIEAARHRIERSAGLLRAAWGGVLAMMVLVEAMAAAPAFGIVLPGHLLIAGMGMLLIVIGNALPKSRPGHFVGIRTPWTMADEANWIATHRFGAKTMIAAGAAILLAALLPIDAATRSLWVRIAIGCAVVPPILYSWLFQRQRRAGG